MPLRAIALVPLVGLYLTALGRPAEAELFAMDQVPAATLLVPYFVVDIAKCNSNSGENTLLKITNASAAPAIAHVTLWTDWGIPSLNFVFYLTGYDVESINLKEIFCEGQLPQSQSISDDQAGHLRSWHRGNESSMTGDCAASNRNSSRAIGYITIDNVDQEVPEGLYPSQSDYWTQGYANKINALLGDVYFFPSNKPKNLPGVSAVHIEADTTGRRIDTGDHTFYGRYLNASAIDAREPLPTTFHVRYTQATAKSAVVEPIYQDHQAQAWIWLIRDGIVSDAGVHPLFGDPNL